ncbi:MBL fold metallo-hydrolase, partial [Streptomyces sp. Act-28]
MEITWWGHATCTVEDSGVRVLTDPLFTRRLAHLRRRRGALPPPEAALADLVLVSHLHADHLHLPSLDRRLRDVESTAAVPVHRFDLGALVLTVVLAHAAGLV